MKLFVKGEDRRQGALMPHCLDDYVTENNPVRVIEAFIDELDLATSNAGQCPQSRHSRR
jgi:transposase